MDDVLKDLIKQFMPFAQKHIGYTSPPRLFLRRDEKNANNALGKTAFYDPAEKTVTLYISKRHPKDVLRSLGHELVHHKQNCEGAFENIGDMGAGYAQENPELRQMEIEANRDGSMCLRDFEDGLKKKNTIYYEHLQEGDYKMSFNDWREKEVSTLLAEAWGFKFNTLEEFNEFNGKGELQAESEEEVAKEAVTEETTEETVEESAAEKEIDEGKDKPCPETEEQKKRRNANQAGFGAGGAKNEELEEAADAEELEEGEEEIEEKRLRGRGGDPRNLRGPKQPGMKMTEAQVREVLKKAIQIVKENNKASKKG